MTDLYYHIKGCNFKEFILTRVKVLDFLCGQGKSTYVRKMVLENPQEKYLYIAPYLSECHRFAGTKYDESDSKKKPLLDDSGAYQYVEDPQGIDLSGMNFRHPNTRNDKGSKEISLCTLMAKGENIVSTHALFTDLGSNVIGCAKDYTLIIDETVNVYEIDSRKKDVEFCLKRKLMYLEEDGVTLRFDRKNLGVSEEGEDSALGSRYEDLAVQCDLGQLLWVNGKAVIWELSVELLKSFKEVWVCTYMFEGSDMASYFKNHGLSYEYASLGEGDVKRSVDVAHLIEVVDDYKLNSIGEVVTLSAACAKVDGGSESRLGKDVVKTTLKNNLHNLFNQKWKAKATDRLWTCFKDQSNFIANGKYGKQFLPFNYKATNKYLDVHHVAFMLDVYQNPNIKKICSQRGLEYSDEHYAISTLIQFIFRSAVRKGEPIKLYLPSSRMRGLLERWKGGEFDGLGLH